MIEVLKRVGKAALKLVLTVTWFAASLAAAYQTLLQPEPRPFLGLALVVLALAANFLSWWGEAKRSGAQLARRLALQCGLLVVLCAFGAVKAFGTIWFPACIAMAVALAIPGIWLGKAYFRMRRSIETKPDPESWRTASSIIYNYGSPYSPGATIAGVLMMWPFLILIAFMFVAGDRHVKSPWPMMFGFIALFFTNLMIVQDRGLKWYRARLRASMPDRPYIWADTLGLSIGNRAFLKWSEIRQIDAIWESGRSGHYETGAYIQTPRAVDGNCINVSLLNATIACDDAVEQMRAMAAQYGCTLPPRDTTYVAASPRWGDQVTSARRVPIRRRSRQEIKALRKDLAERLPGQIAETEQRIADLPNAKIRLTESIARAQESKARVEQYLTLFRAGTSPQDQASAERYAEMKASLEKSLASLQDRLDNFGQREQSLLQTRETLAKLNKRYG